MVASYMLFKPGTGQYPFPGFLAFLYAGVIMEPKDRRAFGKMLMIFDEST